LNQILVATDPLKHTSAGDGQKNPACPEVKRQKGKLVL
jgi:hypothetical protein